MTLDDFHEMALICLEEMKEPNKKAISSAQKRIRDHFREERHKQRILYNPSRNISLNECIGESKTPVSEWLPHWFSLLGRTEKIMFVSSVLGLAVFAGMVGALKAIWKKNKNEESGDNNSILQK